VGLDIVLLKQDGTKIIDRVKNGYLAVDGNYLLPEDSVIFKMRRRMREAGVVVASIVLDDKLRLATSPMLSMPGLLDHIEDGEIIDHLKKDIVAALQDQRKQSKGVLINDQIDSCIRKVLRRGIKQETNKSPVIIINIEEVD